MGTYYIFEEQRRVEEGKKGNLGKGGNKIIWHMSSGSATNGNSSIYMKVHSIILSCFEVILLLT